MLYYSIEPDRQGSDHCPVFIEFEVDRFDHDKKIPTAAFCAKFYMEFAGKQQKIKQFFSISSLSEQKKSQSALSSPIIAHHITCRSTLLKKRKSSSSSSTTNQQKSIKSFFTVNNTESSTSTTTLSTNDIPVSFAFIEDQSKNGAEAAVAAVDEQILWSQLLNGKPPATPLCPCGVPSVQRIVLKKNSNWGRKFYVCRKPIGEKGHPNARCDFFQWASSSSSK
jgi:AP endonuclease-2